MNINLLNGILCSQTAAMVLLQIIHFNYSLAKMKK